MVYVATIMAWVWGMGQALSVLLEVLCSRRYKPH